MTSSSRREPEPLYDEPGGVGAVQVIGYLQMVGVFSCVQGVLGFIGPALDPVADFFADPYAPRIYEDGDPWADARLVFLLTGPAAFIAAFLMAFMIWGIGQGRRWARTGMIAMQAMILMAMAITAVLARSFDLGCFAVLFAPGSVLVVASLMTKPVSQWIRQGGWDQWYQRYYSGIGRKRR